MKCPICNKEIGDLVQVTQHVEAEHPDWQKKYMSKSMLRRVICQTND